VLTDLVNPNGLAFSPDEKKLYVVEWKGTPNRSIWSYDVGADGTTLGNKTKLIDAADQGALDGFRVDRDGNLWCGWGSNGALQAEPSDVGGKKVYQLRGRSEDLDGVMVFSPQGKPLAHIRLPERCANLCFGGPKNNRLYMARATRSTRSTSRRTARPERASAQCRSPWRRRRQGFSARRVGLRRAVTVRTASPRIFHSVQRNVPGSSARSSSEPSPWTILPAVQYMTPDSLATGASMPGTRLSSLRTLAPQSNAPSTSGRLTISISDADEPRAAWETVFGAAVIVAIGSSAAIIEARSATRRSANARRPVGAIA
jgi:hypothetical protein